MHILRNKIPDSCTPQKNKHDNISNILLRELCDEIACPLTKLFNMLEMGKFPQDMKIADVSLLFKNGSRQLLNNYRPILLLPTISKLLKKIKYSMGS